MAKHDTAASGRGKAHRQLAKAQARIDELTAEVVSLQDQVEMLEADVATWRRKAHRQRSRAKKFRAAAEKALAEVAIVTRKRAKAKERVRLVIADHPRAEPLALRGAPSLPKASWTVAQLRVAAQEQGVAGRSRLRKDQLLDRLV
ncbi:MAG: hypothetical protein JWP31_2562 [Aeromicrobium sp.]|nr:hypothetical protein [Aeromicrobium sp.]